MLQVVDHLNLLSAQYLVHCLDTEKTTMDHTPREMKESPITRHSRTVLPLLAITKKDTLHAIHTLFVNTAIDNMMDSRELSNRPPPINSEEILLSRRQRETLSQPCFGLCKLLNSYKKRLKQTDYSSRPDCGMEPQDVPHVFNCTAQPNDLSPVNLWDKPVKMIRELSFLDPGNLDQQMRMAEEGHNNNQRLLLKLRRYGLSKKIRLDPEVPGKHAMASSSEWGLI